MALSWLNTVSNTAPQLKQGFKRLKCPDKLIDMYIYVKKKVENMIIHYCIYLFQIGVTVSDIAEIRASAALEQIMRKVC